MIEAGVNQRAALKPVQLTGETYQDCSRMMRKCGSNEQQGGTFWLKSNSLQVFSRFKSANEFWYERCLKRPGPNSVY
jgi:hypothetical protein